MPVQAYKPKPKPQRRSGPAAAARRAVHRIVAQIRKAKDVAQGRVLRELHTSESRLLVSLGEMKPHTNRARGRRRNPVTDRP